MSEKYNLSFEVVRKSEWLQDYLDRTKTKETPPIVKPQIITPKDPIDRLLEEKCNKFTERSREHYEKEITTIPMGSKPIGIVHFGDPHLDDNGCDLPLLKEHIALAQRTPGCYGGNVGDTTNNWVGRLTKLYANQSTTFDEALVLSEWMIKSIEWAYFVYGNHDHWNDGATILNLLMRDARVHCKANHEAKLDLIFDNGVKTKIVARHNFKGHSMWHPTHGMLRAVQFGHWGDLLVAGHTHEHGLIEIESQQGFHRSGLRVRGYKRFDSFAQEKGFYEHREGCAALSVINPYAPPTDRIKIFWDIPIGIEYLNYLRTK